MGSVTSRVILWTPSGPSAPWGASGPGAPSPGPPSPSSSSSPGLTPLLPSLQTHSIGSIGPGPCVSQDAQDAHQRTRFYKERDSPERGGHFEESPTEILHHRGPAPHGGHLGQQQQVQGLRHPHHQVHRG